MMPRKKFSPRAAWKIVSEDGGSGQYKLKGSVWRDRVTDTGSYLGANAFGRKIKVTKRLTQKLAVGVIDVKAAERWRRLRSSIDGFELEPALAREAMGHSNVLVIGKPVAPFIDAATHGTAPTLDIPIDMTTETKMLVLEVEEMWVYNFDTGEIYKKADENYVSR
ncbi:MAG: hypothetical protein AB1400_08795 [Pseudomonadota bacterium]